MASRKSSRISVTDDRSQARRSALNAEAASNIAKTSVTDETSQAPMAPLNLVASWNLRASFH